MRLTLDMRERIIGITGSIGSGKSTCASIFKEFGARVIDADKITHDLLKPGTAVYKKLVLAFGEEILSGKKIERRKLAQIAFEDKEKLFKLNKIVHPPVIKEIKRQMKKGGPLTVVDAPLLIETGLDKLVDEVVVVKVNKKIQFERLRKKGLSKKDVLKRLMFQINSRQKLRVADFIIDNNNTINETREQIRRYLWKR
jgi:dephospho-CoA kinase